MATYQSSPPIGFPLLPLPDADGRLHFPTLAVSVREMIQVILSTRPGEQLMYPGFGAGLENFVHLPNDLSTRQAIHESIIQSLARWEPRIIVERVDIDDVPDEPGHLRVQVLYRLRRTGEFQQVGLTMEMEG